MSFKFNFDDDLLHVDDGICCRSESSIEGSKVQSLRENLTEVSTCAVAVSAEKRDYISREVQVNWDTFLSSLQPTSELSEYRLIDGSVLQSLSSADVEASVLADNERHCNTAAMTTSALREALAINSDLVPHIYEGGLKIWECSVDLANYLSTLDHPFSSLSVLELGCGAALPGLYALTRGAVVDFQDYNEEVIRRITIPNVAINGQNSRAATWPPGSRFFASDWHDLASLVAGGGITLNCSSTRDKYDVILTSETVYSCESYDALHGAMQSLLRSNGQIYLAGKSCYFGVGGGTRDFAQYVRQRGIFSVDIVYSISIGVEREILQMTFIRKT